MFSNFFGRGNQGNDGGDGRSNYNYVGTNVGRGRADPTNTFLHSYKVYSPAFAGKPEVNRGNKIIMPTSALDELTRMRIQYPMTFMVSNAQMGLKTYCGVLEFSAPEGVVYLPVWMMNNLCVEEGSDIILRNMNLKKGTFVSFRPHEIAFVMLSDPKAILENELTHYSVLHKGDTISIQYGGREYLIDVVETKPDDQICCIETNIKVEFEAALDAPPSPKMEKQSSVNRKAAAAEEEEKDKKLLQELLAKHSRIDGKELTEKQKRNLLEQAKAKEKSENPEFDPRKHRLVHGIRKYRE